MPAKSKRKTAGVRSEFRQMIVDNLSSDTAQTVFLEPAEFDAAIVGMHGDQVVYDEEKIIDLLAKDMPRDDAVEYFDYNIVRGLPYMGVTHPVLIQVLRQSKEKHVRASR